jgi:carbamate kinase
MSRVAVVALGGNAITRSGQAGTYPQQALNAAAMMQVVCHLQAAGWTVVVVHGNGPQVGNLAVQQELGADRVPELPLFVLDAMTQGQLGSLLELAFPHVRGTRPPGMVALVTHIVVDPADAAFARPTKPIGPFLSEAEARRQASARGWVVGEDAGRGYRRMVPSPAPLRILEIDAVRALVGQGLTVIAAGGGGVPVVADGAGYRGVEAVIDKDLAAARLASALGAQALVLVTDVPRVMLDYGTPNARPLGRMTVDEAQAHAEHHQFPEGSMGPKVRACIQFLREGGRIAVITDAERACASLDPSVAEGPETGTRIVTAEQYLGATT